MARTPSSILLAFVLVGCGLTADFDPPDQPREESDARVGMDAGSATTDSGARDASVIDASDSIDAGRMDSGSLDSGSLDSGSLDSGSLDSGSSDSGSSDSGAADLCSSAVNGASCGSTTGRRLICLDRACVVGRCGDSFRDLAAGEECDDGNDVAGDGCEPFACVLTCTSHVDCADSNPCNGEELCERNVCVAGTAVTGDSCRLRDGSEGVCGHTGLCVPPGCGNGLDEVSEECDDGNDIVNDGCESDCTLTCHGDADCDDGDACNGIERCRASTGCVRGPTPLCATPDACHSVSCDPRLGCVITRIDADDDGQSPASLGACGEDCDDSRRDVYKGAPEQCGNGRDDDCDSRVDESATSFDCYPDDDGDGFGDPAGAVRACMCPTGTLTRAGDCFDVSTDPASALVRPDQTEFFTAPYCVAGSDCRFDYDCDGRQEPLFTTVFDGCRLLTLSALCAGAGWDRGVPACGASGNWVECDVGLSLTGSLLCRERRTTRTQPCR